MTHVKRVQTFSAAIVGLALTQAVSAGVYSTTAVTVATPTTSSYTQLLIAGESSTGIIVGYEVSNSVSTAARQLWTAGTPSSGITLLPELTDSSHTYTTGTGNYGAYLFRAINASGQVLTQVYRTAGTASEGYDAAIYMSSSSTPIVLAMPTPSSSTYAYSAYNGTATVASVTPAYLTDNGIASGIASRYNQTTATTYNTEGQDAWVYTPATGTAAASTVQVGLTGAGYFFIPGLTGVTANYEYSAVAGTNSSGVTVGYSNRYLTTGASSFGNATDGGGSDAWIYLGTSTSGSTTGTNGTNSYQIGLVGNGYSYAATTTLGTTATFEQSRTTALNSANQVAGYSTAYTSTGSNLGNETWIYTPGTGLPTTATAYGTTSGGTYTHVGLDALSSGSLPTGISYVSNGSTAYHNSTLNFLNNAGQASGSSTRYLTSSGITAGSDAWYFNGTTTKLISPNGTIYYSSSNTSTSTVSAMNSSGLTAGASNRYSGTTLMGQDAWVYNPADNSGNGSTIILPIPGELDANYADSAVGSLTDSGIALGYYRTYSGTTASTYMGTYVFVWSETAGFETLGQLSTINSGTITVGTASSSIASFIASYYKIAADGNIYFTDAAGTGLFEYAATAVPEPASLGLLAAGGLLLLRRRRA